MVHNFKFDQYVLHCFPSFIIFSSARDEQKYNMKNYPNLTTIRNQSSENLSFEL
jgi:hypothetical protein